MKTIKHQTQRGVFLLEALIAILIFSLGILGMVALSGASVAAQSDSRFRTEAANLASEVAGIITLGVDRTSGATTQATLANFVHNAGGGNCAFTAAPSASPEVLAWAAKLTAPGTGLPGATADNQQIAVQNVAGDFNRVTITVCWQAPNDKAPRSHTHVTYVN